MIETDDSAELRERLARAEQALERYRKNKADAQSRWRKKQRMGAENACVETTSDGKAVP